MIFTSLSLQSCEKKKEAFNPSKTIATISDDSLKIDSSTISEKKVSYSVKIEKIDSVEFNRQKKISAPKKKTLKKITNIQEVKKMLKGVVAFDENDLQGENPAIKTIHFRNGKKYGKAHEHEVYSFIAYFPEEDILLCEGGHTIDISFNLKNGRETEETGNPDEIVFSPKENFRLNGNYGGQQCFAYFIQQKKNRDFEKIIDLTDEFSNLIRTDLCLIGDSFWQNENTLLIIEDSNFGVNQKYFKISLVEK